MDDLASKISELLNNPESLNQIKGLSGLLGQNPSEKEKKKESPSSAFDLNAFPPDMMQKIMKIMPIISSMNKEDKNTKFLQALKPLLSESKQKKVDESIKMLNMMKIMPALKNQDLF